MSQAGELNSANNIVPVDVATSYVTDSGTAVPVANILDVFGGSGISTAGSGNVVTITNQLAQPNAFVFLQDDFIGTATGVTSGDVTGALSWFDSSATGWNQTSTLPDNAHPGILGNKAITTNDSGLFLSHNSNIIVPEPQIILGGGVLTVNWVIKIVTLSVASPRYILRVGLGDTANADQANGLYFEYSDNINTGKWNFKSAASSVRTTSTSSIAVTIGYHNLQIIVNAAASSVSFSVDGVSLGAAIVTNIPILAVTPFVDIVESVGTVAANSILLDLFYLKQTLTTPR